jgi:hypothetical protein
MLPPHIADLHDRSSRGEPLSDDDQAILNAWYAEQDQAEGMLLGHQPSKEAAMMAVTLREIDERLRQLPPEKLAVVYDFISYLIERDVAALLTLAEPDAREAALASESVLRRDWDRPEEEAAWAHL